MKPVSHGIDRIAVTFDEPGLVANAGLLLIATLVKRLGLEELVDAKVRIPSKLGGFSPGRKVCTLVHAMVAGATHIDHADVLRAGATEAVLSHRVMAPSTLGAFLRAFTFGHVRQLEAVVAEVLRHAWNAMTLPSRLVVDVDSTICEVTGKKKAGAAYGYTKVLGLHPLLATRADTGEVLHARLRKAPPTPSAAPSASSKSSSPDSAGPGHPAPSSCGSTQGSGRRTSFLPWSAWGCPTPWLCGRTRRRSPRSPPPSLKRTGSQSPTQKVARPPSPRRPTREGASSSGAPGSWGPRPRCGRTGAISPSSPT